MDQKKHLSPNLSQLVATILFMGLCMANQISAQSVDPLTGRAIIDLPLGSIGVKDLSASVSLTHQGGALQVGQGPGNAGMGWNVSFGGQITREVRGLPDELNADGKTGWLHNGNAASIQGLGTTASYSFISGLGYVKDSEPDIFYFSAPGISGKFLYGADGQIKLIPYQDLKITGSIVGNFTIQTNNGLLYSFAVPQSTTRQSVKVIDEGASIDHYLSAYNNYLTPITYTSTWHLSSITSQISNETMSFTYQTDGEGTGGELFKVIQPNIGSATNHADSLFSWQEKSSQMLLTQINLKNYSISIDWASSLVYSITISESESGESKRYDFEYRRIFSFGATNQYLSVSKPFLLKVREVNSTICSAFPSYVFSYMWVDTTVTNYPQNNNTIITGTAQVNWDKGWGQDYFGYFNGKSNNKNIPTIYYYAGETGARRYRVTPIPGLTPTQTLHGVNTSEQTMNVDPTYTAFGALTRIYYPTGGVTSIWYEPNKYIDTSTGEELFGPGVRVANISTSGGESAFGGDYKGIPNQFHSTSTSYQYTQSSGTLSSGKILYPPSYAFTNGTNIYRSQNNLGQFAQVYYSRVKEVIDGQGYRVYEYDVPNMYPDANPIVPTARHAAASTPVGTFVDTEYAYPYAPVQDIDFKRGALTKVTEFTATNVMTQERQMSYQLPQSSANVQALRFESLKDANGAEVFAYSIYQIPIGQSQLMSQEITRAASEETTDVTTMTTNYTYNSKNMLMQTSTTNDDNSTVVQSVKYAMDFPITAPAAGDDQAYAIWHLNTYNRYSEIIETTETFTPRNGSAVTRGARLNLFKVINAVPQLYQTKSFPQGVAFTSATITAGATQGFNPNTNYILEGTTEYVNGMPNNQKGIDLITRSTHYTNGHAAPIISFINCKHSDAIYEGFEYAKERGLEYAGSGSPVYQSGRTGKNAALLTNASPFRTSLGSTNLITKGEPTYRLSAWVYSTQAGAVRVSVNGTTPTTDLNFTATNQWVYVEKIFDVSSAVATFYLTLTNPGATAILLDDFLAVPVGARATFHTFLPFKGTTSQTDDRGNSVVVNYDAAGRKTSTFDRQRNMVELQEYALQRQGTTTLTAGVGMALQAGFDTNVTKHIQSQQILFSAAENCLQSVSYTWTFIENGATSTATGKDVYKTFSTFGQMTVKLVVSSPGYVDAVTTQKICVSPSFTHSVTMTRGPYNNIYNCNNNDPNDSGVRTFNTVISGAPLTGWTLDYNWNITDAQGIWHGASYYSGVTFSGGAMSYASPGYTYQVNCVIVASKPNYPFNECDHNFTVGTASSSMNYIVNPNCQ